VRGKRGTRSRGKPVFGRSLSTALAAQLAVLLGQGKRTGSQTRAFSRAGRRSFRVRDQHADDSTGRGRQRPGWWSWATANRSSALGRSSSGPPARPATPPRFVPTRDVDLAVDGTGPSRRRVGRGRRRPVDLPTLRGRGGGRQPLIPDSARDAAARQVSARRRPGRLAACDDEGKETTTRSPARAASTGPCPSASEDGRMDCVSRS